MLIGFTTLNFGAKALGQSGVAARDPVAEFADVLPGQPKSAIVARGFSCPALAYRSPNEHCSLRPKRSAFSHVDVDIVSGRISHSSFNVRSNLLRVGELVLLWGIPEIEAGANTVVLRWHRIDTTAIATSHTGKFSFLLGVDRLFISAKCC